MLTPLVTGGSGRGKSQQLEWRGTSQGLCAARSMGGEEVIFDRAQRFVHEQQGDGKELQEQFQFTVRTGLYIFGSSIGLVLSTAYRSFVVAPWAQLRSGVHTRRLFPEVQFGKMAGQPNGYRSGYRSTNKQGTWLLLSIRPNCKIPDCKILFLISKAS